MRKLVIIFLLSGTVGLGYQVLWSKSLLDFIGAGAYSYATVLAAFMAGLALGSALVGRLVDRTGNPLRLYACLEAGIGLFGLAYPRLIHVVAWLYGRWVQLTPEHSGAGPSLLAKAAVCGLMLLLPTTLMGGTYPAMLRHATDRLGLLGRNAALLYAANAVGAVLGSLLVAFLLMPMLGIQRSLLVLCLANALLALAALALSIGPRRSAATVAGVEDIAAPPESVLGNVSAVRLALAFVFVEGFVAFALEIAWTRFFAIVLGSSAYSFAVMLAAFISGIALGSAWLARLEGQLEHPLRFFGWTQIAAALCLALTLPFYPYLPWLLLNYGTLFSTQHAAFYLYQAGILVAAYLVMLPPTVFLGMALPLVVTGLGREVKRLGRDAGLVYAWNTWGNVLGAVGAGLVLLPAFGMERLLRAAALGSASVGLAAVWLFTSRPSARRARATATGAVALVAGGLLATPWRNEWFVIMPYRRATVPSSLQAMRSSLANDHVLLFEDDAAAHVMVYDEAAPGRSAFRAIAVNGKIDASTGSDMPTQILAGHVPLLLAPDPRQVLVIGLASGVTCGAVLAHPVDRLDVVEIVGSMPKATRLFSRWNGDPLADPRLHLIVDDARSYLSYTRRTYDVVISEPSNPWMAGVGGLYSRDFYARAARALRPEGVYLQWVQGYELSDESFATVVRTFHGVFPYVYGFQGASADLLLVGSRRPLQPDWPAVERRLARSSVQQQLRELQIEDLATLLAFQQLSPPTAAYIGALTDVETTDDNHLLEYRAPLDLFRQDQVTLVRRLDERLHAAPSLFWSQFVHLSPGAVRPLTALQAFSDERIGVAAVVNAYLVASYHLSENISAETSRSGSLLSGDQFLVDPPLSPAVLADALARLARRGRGEAAARLLEPYAAAILLESALSPDKASFWNQRVLEWPILTTPRFRMFRIDLLMAAGRSEEAARELTSWTRESPPPEPAWAVLRACQLGPQLCSQVAGEYALWHPAPFLRRLGVEPPVQPR